MFLEMVFHGFWMNLTQFIQNIYFCPKSVFSEHLRLYDSLYNNETTGLTTIAFGGAVPEKSHPLFLLCHVKLDRQHAFDYHYNFFAVFIKIHELFPPLK